MLKLQKLVQLLDNPRVAKKIHGWLALLWFIAAFPAMLTGLKNSVPFLVFISVYAIVAGHFAGWDAAGGEVELERLHKKQDKADKRGA
jgi:hypothetical protein